VNRTLHFSLGPVQGFVAQARRTRDFWAGSFLLSYLSGHAMNYIVQHGGEITFPAVKDEEGELEPLLRAIQAHQNGSPTEDAPIMGSLPNRFRARIPNEFNPDGYCKAVRNAWREIANKVYQKYVLSAEDLGYGTRSIWNRQIQGFWDMVWVLGEESNILELRKNWRSHILPDEPGDKCTIMGNMQEISGYIRAKQKDKQDKFWEKVKKTLPLLDLRDDERLCAISMVKRLFPRVAQETIGWTVPDSFPSTVYMSAVPWMVEILKKNKEFAQKFVDLGTRISGVLSEYGANINSLENLAGTDAQLKKFISLDGNCFYTDSLANDELWQGEGREDNKEVRNELINMLKKQEVSPFYAFLLMDGDKMGALLQKHSADQENISQAINSFSRQVADEIKTNNGIGIFAGGDDVLAFLPMNSALQAVIKLRQKYQDVFSEKVPEVPRSQAAISAAIVYAHNRAPLNLIYQYGQNLLSQKAKDETGRDAVAISVWKTGGPVLTWSAPWQVIIHEDGNNLIDKLVKDFSGGSGEEEKYSSSFFYNLNKLLKTAEIGGWLPYDSELERLLAAEYMRSRGKISIETALPRMRDLVKIIRKFQRREDGTVVTTQSFNGDGALLVKFLAGKGVFV
jgi:CRISPR-associated protein Cmr2